MNFNKICVLDLETDSPNPNTCNPTQIASVIINPRTLEIIKDSEFCSYIQPPNVPDINKYKEHHKDTIEWHAKTQKCTADEIVDKWFSAPLEKDVFENFQAYLLKYHTRTNNKNKFSAPIVAGYNILKFDLPILQRLAVRYNAVDKEDAIDLFNPRDRLDVMLIAFLWFENLDEPKSYSMDVLRDFLGIKSEGSHDAIKDVQDTAELLIRFLKLHRKTANRVTFKNSFKEKK